MIFYGLLAGILPGLSEMVAVPETISFLAAHTIHGTTETDG
jgi:hypothetical protein